MKHLEEVPWWICDEGDTLITVRIRGYRFKLF